MCIFAVLFSHQLCAGYGKELFSSARQISNANVPAKILHIPFDIIVHMENAVHLSLEEECFSFHSLLFRMMVDYTLFSFSLRPNILFWYIPNAWVWPLISTFRIVTLFIGESVKFSSATSIIRDREREEEQKTTVHHNNKSWKYIGIMC